MAPLTRALLAAAALLSISSSVVAEASPKAIAFDIEKRRVSAPHAPSLIRRGTVNSAITNELLLYFINVTVGTPPQPFSLQLDTGSSDIWFPAASSDICQYEPDACAYGSYDANASSTFVYVSSDFEIQYVDGSQIEGDYITDDLVVGGAKLTKQTMAAALSATRGIGIMGVGFQSGESISQEGGSLYPNVINVLKNEGYINTLAYSLWLNDLDSNTGSILFGGVDTDKYSGELIGLPIQVDSLTGNIDSFTVAWTGLSVTSGGKTSQMTSSGFASPAILDSGTTNTYVPNDIATALYNGFGVLQDPNYGNVIDCDVGGDDAVLSFQFGGSNGPTIKVGINEFVTPLLTADGSTPKFPNGKLACTFAIDSAGQDPILFGDSFLRSAYVVYDLEAQVIGIAQTQFNSSSSNIVEFTGTDIPGVTSTASGATIAQTFSGVPLATQAAASGTGGVNGATMSATFLLQASSTGSSSGSSSHNDAAATLRPERSTVIAAVVVLTSFVFGGSLMFWL